MNFWRLVWQLPQTMLGALVVLFTGARKVQGKDFYVTTAGQFGVSLGYFIIFGVRGYTISGIDYHHEVGHRRQSELLGPLYLLLIGLPSLFGNIWDRLFHSKWRPFARYEWYYKLPWEAWADSLGNVVRFNDLEV